MSDRIPKDAAAWLNAVSAWLAMTNDPRLKRFPDGRMSITDAAGASADFCAYMATKAKAEGR